MDETSKEGFCTADRMMHDAVASGVFPGAVLLVARGPDVLLHRAYGVGDLAMGRRVTLDTVFDLASLTKPLATTPALMCLAADGLLALDTALEDLLPSFRGRPAAGVTVEQLLRHTSGLPAWFPYFERLRDLPTAQRWPVLKQWLSDTAPEAPPGERTVYSDLNFLILGWIVEHLSQTRLDRFAAHRIYRPFEIAPLGFIDLSKPAQAIVCAATERCPWRRRTLVGQVHDDNCWMLGGICGHSGLFGTAGAVHRLLSCLLDALRGNGAGVLAPDWVQRFLEVPTDGRRPLGFDRPSGAQPSCGLLFSRRTAGHLGFTGCSFWMDLERRIIVVLLTNRVHPTRCNQAIRAFRPRLHDAVWRGLPEAIFRLCHLPISVSKAEF